MAAAHRLVFRIGINLGDVIERDYPVGLYRALAALLPWLEDEPLAGVHPMRGLTPCPAGLLVGGRTRITLRVPEHRAAACAACCRRRARSGASSMSTKR